MLLTDKITLVTASGITLYKMKFHIKDFFSKSEQIFKVSFIEEILNGKFHEHIFKVSFIEEILNGKFHVSCCESSSIR